jgi:hypothetical protein
MFGTDRFYDSRSIIILESMASLRSRERRLGRLFDVHLHARTMRFYLLCT